MEFNELLEKVELSTYEKMAYKALLILNENKVLTIAKESKVPRGRIYEALEALSKKGLITPLPTSPQRYRVNEPKTSLQRLIGEKQEQLSKLKEDIETIKIPRIVLNNQVKEEFEIITSESIYFERLKEFKKKAKKEFVSIISGSRTPKFVGVETRDMLKRGVKYKTIVNEVNDESIKYIREKIKLGSEIKLYPINGIKFIIADRKEILISIINEDNFRGLTVYVTHQDFINSMIEFFNAVWEKGRVI